MQKYLIIFIFKLIKKENKLPSISEYENKSIENYLMDVNPTINCAKGFFCEAVGL